MIIIRANLFNDYGRSFIKALDEATIQYGQVQLFSEGQNDNNSVISIYSAIADSMPWKTLANVIVAWLEAKTSREVIITSKENIMFHAKGYPAADISKMLSQGINITIVNNEQDE